MFDDNLYIPIPPIPMNDFNQSSNKEILVKEDFSQLKVKKLSSEKVDIILPDEMTIKEKKKEDF